MKKINIDNLTTFEEPTYILVAGAIGAGKSTVVGKHLSKYLVVDPDTNTMVIGNGEYNPKNVAESMALTKKQVQYCLEHQTSFVQQGTSANLKSTINKLKDAKNKGFKTVLLYIDTPLETSIKNVSKRDERNSIPQYKIERTYNGSKATVEYFLDIENQNDTTYLDYVVKYNNSFV